MLPRPQQGCPRPSSSRAAVATILAKGCTSQDYMTVNAGAGARPQGMDDPAQESQLQEGWEGAHGLGTVSTIDPSQRLALMISDWSHQKPDFCLYNHLLPCFYNPLCCHLP